MSWFEPLDRGGKRRRHRRLSPMVLLLGMTLYGARGLRNLRDAFSDVLAMLEPEEPPRAISKGSIGPARERLPVELLDRALEHVREVAAEVPRPDRLCGFRVICLDGTTFAVADTPENDQAYGRQSSARGKTGYPRLRSVLAMDAATHLFIDEEHGAYALSEAALMAPLLPRLLGAGDLVESDRNFLSFERASTLLRLGAEFLVRVKSQLRLPILRELSDGSYLTVYCTKKMRSSRKRSGRLFEELDRLSLWELEERAWAERMEMWNESAPPREALILRVIEYDVVQENGDRQTSRLLTSMLCTEELSATAAAEGYHLRWSEEGGIRELKWLSGEFRIPHLPGKSPETIEQDLRAVLLAHSVLRATMLLSSAEHDLDPARLSLSGARAVLGRFLVRLPHRSSRRLPIWLEALLSEIARHSLPAPQRRLCPRAVKVKMTRWPTKSRSKSPPSVPDKRTFEFRATRGVFA